MVACGTSIKEWAFSVEERQNGGRLTQMALCRPLPLQWGWFLRGGDRSSHLVKQTEKQEQEPLQGIIEYLSANLSACCDLTRLLKCTQWLIAVGVEVVDLTS